MPVLKRYIRKEPFSGPELKTGKSPFSFSAVFGFFFSFVGISILAFQVFSPFLSLASDLSHIKPVSEEYFLSLIEKEEGFAFKELAEKGIAPVASEVTAIPEVFFLSIPRLGIEKAVVETNSLSLAPDKRLGHLKGSALPSEAGEIFIYGHSTYPVLFNSRDYKTIFSTLDKLKVGDGIEIQLLDMNYKYIVKNLKVLPPKDVKPLLKQSLRETLTLMTCYPFGTTKDRLLISAERVYQ